MRARVTTLLEVLGMGLVSVGAGMWEIPAGVVAAGISLIVVGWRTG